ncbi:MAG: recombinase family protein [Faecalicoccus sp.]|uniref:recombinase family protein n=1 Tax=unclassified Faecalicoccus TaxID=2643311 RepID=UPI002A804CBA|nr:recombinase family protein [Faecalicoccus sp.]MDY4870807.1 recombinase family protein [Faecalicoccus sp.]
MARITKIEATPSLAVNKKVRVAAYARVSTKSDEQLLSLETQKEHYDNFINANSEWEYAGLYYDEGISGTKVEKREGLLSLLKDCEDGKIDRVITKSISRFSRNTTDCLEMVRRLASLNIFLYFEKENIDTEHMCSELMLSILSSIAESESRSISENEKWSITKRYQNGTFIIGYPPFGYDNVDGKMVIVPEEAIEKNMEQQTVLVNLMSAGYLEPEIFHMEKNQLVLEADELAKDKELISKSINGDLTHLEEAKKLLRFASKKSKIESFDDDMFMEYVDTITVMSREEIVFNLKCGLHLTERLVEE